MTGALSVVIILFTCGLIDVASEYSPLRVITENDKIIDLAIPSKGIQDDVFLHPGGMEFKIKNACPPEANGSLIEKDALVITTQKSCTKEVTPTIKPGKKDSCPYGFDAYNIGFNIYLEDSEYKFLRLVRVCFHSTAGVLLTVHRVPMVDIPTTSSVDLEKFHTAGFDEGWEIGSAYDEMSDLIPQQLVRSDDFYLNVWKSCTYYYFNEVPIWRTIATQWNTIINDLIELTYRNYSKRKFISIMSGTYGIYTDEEHPEGLYLKNGGKKFEVPLYHWKMFLVTTFDDTTQNLQKKKILVIMHNTPRKENRAKLCKKSVCADVGWSWKVEDLDTKNPKTLVAYCCYATDDLLVVLRIKGYKFQAAEEIENRNLELPLRVKTNESQRDQKEVTL